MGQQAKRDEGPGAAVTIAAVEPGDGHLLVRWGDGHESRFAYVWLRHACFFPANTDRGREALASNVANGTTAAGLEIEGYMSGSSS